MSGDAPQNLSTSASFPSRQPVNIDGEPLLYNNNKAQIPALLELFGEWGVRTHHYVNLHKYHGVLVKQY